MREEQPSVLEDVVSKLVIAHLSVVDRELAVKIAEGCLGLKDPDLSHLFMDPRKFTGGEFCPKFMVPLTGKSVYILLFPGPYKSPEELMERACMTSRAAREYGAEKVILLATEFPHSRQDRGSAEDQKALGEPNTISWHAEKLYRAGVDQVIVTHEHSPRIPAFFAKAYGLLNGVSFSPTNSVQQALGRKVFLSLSLHGLVADYFLHHSSLVGSEYLKEGGRGLVLKVMDKGNWTFIDELWGSLFLPNASRLYCNKSRMEKNVAEGVQVEVSHVSENFETLEGKLEAYADDGLDTGGTMLKAVEWSTQGNHCSNTGKTYGTPEDRIVYFTHAWLGGEGHLGVQQRLVKNLPTREFVTTNTRPYIGDSQHYRFKAKSTILRLAGLWSDAILANELKQDLIGRYSNFASEEEQHQFLQPLYVLKRHSRHFLVEREPQKKKILFYYR